MSTSEDQAHAQTLMFTVGQPELLAALTFVGRALPKRPNVPVLTGVVLAGDGQTVTIEAFDYEQARRVVLPGATCTRPGSVLVAASKLTEMVKALPKARPVTLAGECVKVRLSNGKTTYTIPTMPIEDYPARPDMPPTVGMIGSSVLAGQVAQVAKFAGTDETLPMMTAVRVSSEGGRLSLEATDRYRLAVRDFDWANEVDKFAALVPGKLLAEVAKAFGKTPGVVVTLGYDLDGGYNATFGLETDHVRVVTRTIDGANYPPVRSLIPKHAVLEVDLDTAALVAAVKRVEVTAERSTPVVLRFADDVLTLEAGTSDDARASEVLDEECTFVTMTSAARAEAVNTLMKEAAAQARKRHARDPKEVRDQRVVEARQQACEEFERATGMTLGVNPSYLLDVLNVGAARVRMRLVHPYKPFLIVPLDADGAPVPGVTNLLMTIRITGGASEAPEQPAPPSAASASATDAQAERPAETGSQSGGTDGAAEARQAREAPVPAVIGQTATAAAEAVLDPEEPHIFRRAVEDGTKPNPFTKCTCGRIRNAKVHGGRQAAAKAAAAAGVSGQVPAAVPEGPIWMAVLQLAARVDGRMVTEATEDGARKAVEQFGRAVVVLVSGDGNGKRMYVGARSREDADLMQRVACAFGIPAHTAQGVWPPQGGNGPDGAQARAVERPPVIVDGEPTFDPRATSLEAFMKLGTGDFDGALALIATAMEVAPEHRFHDRQHDRTYGWAEIERAILAKQAEAEIQAEAERDALADIAAETPTQTAPVAAGPSADGPEPDTEREQPQVPTGMAPDVDDEPEPQAVAAPRENTVITRLREALAGQPDDVIEAAVDAAMAKMQTKSVAAAPAPRPQPEAPAVKRSTSKTSPAAATVKPQAVPTQVTAPADEVARWQAFGMVPPITLTGERVFVLPAGTRLRALRKAVVDAMTEAKRNATIATVPTVEADKSARPYRLRIRFAEPGALTAASALVNDAVAAALPDVLPARAAA
ncbi:DNA polymerase III subunit beta [Actinoplanes sp. NPDC049118]|uniref:DNA polymerase III subunit beta n=1 Tax=Actinoplanes sp. NPDC049118 TaxID=3155769 RepID=UPI0033FFCFEC